ncbi:MAG: cytochrome c [Chlorobiota bacterium]|nr:MAG: cytochrome c [Chlorobiota bacterium]
MHVRLAVVTGVLIVIGCGGRNESAQPATKAELRVSDRGVGPITEVTLGPLDEALAKKGKIIFEQKCNACHKIDERYVGPAIKGVTTRRKPEWIMNMIVNPTEMLEKDPIAKDLLATYLTPMTFQNVTKDQARAILEYFRQVDGAPTEHVSQSKTVAQ